MKSLIKSDVGLFVLIFLYTSIPVLGGLIRVLELAGGPAIAPENLRASADPLPIVLHILSSVVFCIIGAVQFFPDLRRRHPKTHRILGRFVAISGLVSAATGVWMTHFYTFPESLQSPLLYAVRMGLGPLMAGLIVWAVIAVRSGNIFRHSAAMLRAYAIAQGAATQAILGVGWIAFTGDEATGAMRDVIMISAWALNLGGAEVVIRKQLAPMWRRKRATA